MRRTTTAFEQYCNIITTLRRHRSGITATLRRHRIITRTYGISISTSFTFSCTSFGMALGVFWVSVWGTHTTSTVAQHLYPGVSVFGYTMGMRFGMIHLVDHRFGVFGIALRAWVSIGLGYEAGVLGVGSMEYDTPLRAAMTCACEYLRML